MKPFSIAATRQLPDHDAVLQAILSFFKDTPGVAGCFLGGSTAANRMDADSDLDIGIVMQDAATLDAVWQRRWDWNIAPWFHRFDADHIRPYFVIYLFEPRIKADIGFCLLNQLPTRETGAFVVVWDNEDRALTRWFSAGDKPHPPGVSWQTAVHEDERFWAWLFCLYGHLHRGEFYNCAYEFPVVRDILEQWHARLAGLRRFNTRRLEQNAALNRIPRHGLFPTPDKETIKAALLRAIQEQLAMRKEIEGLLGPVWKTNSRAIEKITGLIQRV